MCSQFRGLAIAIQPRCMWRLPTATWRARFCSPRGALRAWTGGADSQRGFDYGDKNIAWLLRIGECTIIRPARVRAEYGFFREAMTHR